ncbi:MAG: hypothetical protein ABIG67_04615 [Pseudomonadota bacterium]
MEKMIDYHLIHGKLLEHGYGYDQVLWKETTGKKEKEPVSENETEIGEYLTATYLG